MLVSTSPVVGARLLQRLAMIRTTKPRRPPISVSLTVVDGLEIKGLYAAKLDGDEPNKFVDENWEYGIGFNYEATEDVNVYVSHFDADSDDPAGTIVRGNRACASGIHLQSEVTFLKTDQKDFRTRVVRSF